MWIITSVNKWFEFNVNRAAKQAEIYIHVYMYMYMEGEVHTCTCYLKFHMAHKSVHSASNCIIMAKIILQYRL